MKHSLLILFFITCSLLSFSQKGEIYFRKAEHEIFKKIVSEIEPMVISTGGGTPCYANNHLLLNSDKTVSIYLKASIETLFERLSVEKQQRPIIADKSENELKEFIAQHLFERSYYYHQATFTIVVDAKSPEDIVGEIMNLLV